MVPSCGYVTAITLHTWCLSWIVFCLCICLFVDPLMCFCHSDQMLGHVKWHLSLRSIFCTMNFRVWKFWMLTNWSTGIECHRLSSSGQKNARLETYCLKETHNVATSIENVHLVKDHVGSLWPGGKKIEKPCRRSGKSFEKKRIRKIQGN